VTFTSVPQVGQGTNFDGSGVGFFFMGNIQVTHPAQTF
jgi:hypothetical protein